MLFRFLPCAAAAALAIVPGAARAQSVPTPASHLGHPVGADSVLPGWNAVRTYFEGLDAASARVTLEKVGKTTEGRDFVAAIVTSEENMARLGVLKEHARVLADPRGAKPAQIESALADGKVFLMVSCAMHATEVAAPQFGMQFAHLLATSNEEPWVSARRELVVVILPSSNPDGQDHVADWYAKIVGTPYEDAGLTKLYQQYAGHDNNRDWFMLSLAETRIVTRLLYADWRPQIYWDVHQQGSRQERMFVPPFRDPLNPNLDAGVIAAINLLGTRGQLDMTRAGLTGVATGGTYDMWWNGGNRNVPVRHGIVGILTEAASARLASPIYLPRSELKAPDGTGAYAPSNSFLDPWPGGWWRIGDIVAYETAFARSLVASLARERRFYLENRLEAARRAIRRGEESTPRAWILPADQDDVAAVERLCGALLATGVECEVANEAVTADGRTWPAGSIVIRRAQPYGDHVQDLFDVQRYPAGADAPYDVAGWTLPLLLGVQRVECVELPKAATSPKQRAEDLVAGFRGPESARKGRAVFDTRDGRGWKRVFAEMKAGKSLAFGWKAGDEGLFAPCEPGKAAQAFVDAYETPARLRVGLYSPWSGDMDEGWMRWVFDEFGVPYTTVRNEALRAGELLRDYDVLVLPGTSAKELVDGRAEGSVFPEYAEGLSTEGSAAIESFVRSGGTLVAVGNSARFAVEQLKLPLLDTTAEPESKDFSCPGSVLRAIPDGTSRFTAGLPESVAIFGARPQAWRPLKQKEGEALGASNDTVEVLLRYAPTQTLLSGWIQKPEVIANQPAWLRIRHGSGQVHLFSFRPQYRSWSQQAFQLLFRAITLR
ncbi:MAG: M14 family metallopeptidase [Planctomycetota bacterium]|nr:M14 family metallopeptidase [Planctomycetota bacterium]